MSDTTATALELEKIVKQQKQVIATLLDLVENIRTDGLPHHMLEGSYEKHLTTEIDRLRMTVDGLKSELVKRISEDNHHEDLWIFGPKHGEAPSHETK